MCTCGLKNIQKLCWFDKTPKTDKVADVKYDLLMQVAWNTRNFIPQPPKLEIPGTIAGEMSLTAALEEIVPATIPGRFIPGVTDHEGLVNQMQRVRPVDDGKKARLLTHLTPEKPEIIKALEMFWENREYLCVASSSTPRRVASTLVATTPSPLRLGSFSTQVPRSKRH